MNLSFRENYWDSRELKAEFLSFLERIHGLDLSLWDKMGFWDEKYRPFSYFNGNALVANVCVYSMTMTIQSKRRLVAQISGVGTIPEYRRRGLSFDLTQKALEWARNNHDLFYLFAENEASALYRKCGFRQIDEYKACVSVSCKDAQPGAVKLDMERSDHVELIYRLVTQREPVSDILGVSNSKLFMFWCLHSLRDHVYYISELNLLVIYKRVNGLITMYDIVGASIPAFSAIYPYFCHKSDEKIEFLFMADKLDLGSYDLIKVADNGTHILGDFPVESSKFIFPFTAHA